MRPALAIPMLLALVGPARAGREETVPGHLVVRYRTPRPAPGGARIERRLAGAVHLLHADGEEAADALLRRLAADPDVEWVEREHVRRRDSVSANDKLFAQQWALKLTQLPQAWSRSRGSESVVVAVLDSGIQPHPDLEGRYLPGYDFVSNPEAAGDGDGRDADPSDAGTLEAGSSGLHGMHVAGIIGAHTNNATGIAGVDWSCRILPVRVLDVRGGRGADTDIADAVRWAAGFPVEGVPDNPTPAAVINMSFGGYGASGVLQAAIDDAHARGVIVVASAGNSGSDVADYAPASLNHVIAVGAVDASGQLAGYSNRGPRVDLVAPGGDLAAGAGVVSTVGTAAGGFSYLALQGTSQAAPHVAGVAALMKAVNPRLGADEARAMLVYHSNREFQCADGCGGGLLDANATLAAVEEQCRTGDCSPPLAPGVEVVSGCNVTRGESGVGLVVCLLLGLVLRRRRAV